MSCPIEDYALLGDTQAAALVGRDGSIDWLCLPRFDSGACFAALLGGPDQGRWKIAPSAPVRRTHRRYREGTLVLETEFETESGTVRVIDTMPPRDKAPDVMRVVEGVSGRVPVRMELVIRFDYGSIVPWVHAEGGALRAVAGPDALILRTPAETRGEGLATVADFEVRAGQRVPFVLTWHPSYQSPPPALDADEEVAATEHWWRRWSSRCTYRGPYREAVVQSLLVLKALTYEPTGGIVAAPTTSLPEWIGGARNWDYRFCWLRDATLTLQALLAAGYEDEAAAWRDWLLRAVAGDPAKLQIMYGIRGERRLTEWEVPWLPGYAGSRPVRIGNGAAVQVQHDVYGEVLDTMYQAYKSHAPPEPHGWDVQRAVLEYLESGWRDPGSGIWETRGPLRHFTYAKVMSWVAFDRAVKIVERLGLEGPVDRWRAARDAIHAEVCEKGYDAGRNTFTQAYGSRELDASVLRIPLVGFLPPDDPRVVGTVRAVERELIRDGLVLRYPNGPGGTDDGLCDPEGAFLACSFWLADCYASMGRYAEANQLFERLLALRNDVGLLAEEYDPRGRRRARQLPAGVQPPRADRDRDGAQPPPPEPVGRTAALRVVRA
ncbi:MAG: glycoside hydrolase family 15 protein [Minicystis sp.]